MRVACSYCGGGLPSEGPAPYGLCPACHGRLEEELTDTAVQVGRARPDAETVLDIALPDGWAPPTPSASAKT